MAESAGVPVRYGGWESESSVPTRSTFSNALLPFLISTRSLHCQDGSMAPPHVLNWLRQATANYVYQDQTIGAISSALDQYPSLKIKTDQYSESTCSSWIDLFTSMGSDHSSRFAPLAVQPSMTAGRFSCFACTGRFPSPTRLRATTSRSPSGCRSTLLAVHRWSTLYLRAGCSFARGKV